MNKSLANVLKYIVFLGIAFGLLYLAFKDIKLEKMWQELRNANYSWVAAGMACGYLAVISRGLRWNILIDTMGYHPRPYSAVHAVSIGYLANLAVPRLGEIARCTAMNRAERVPVDKLIGTVLLERVVDILMLGLFLLLSLFLKYEALSRFIGKGLESRSAQGGNLLWLWIAIAIAAGGTLGLYIFRKTLLSLKWVGKVRNLLIGVMDGFRTVFSTKRKLEFVLHTLFIWGMYFLMSFLYFFCLPGTSHLTISDGIFLMVVGGLGMIAPAPGGIGAFHYAMFLGLTTLEIDPVSANSFGFISHSSQTVMLLLTGALALFSLSLSGKKNRDAVF